MVWSPIQPKKQDNIKNGEWVGVRVRIDRKVWARGVGQKLKKRVGNTEGIFVKQGD